MPEVGTFFAIARLMPEVGTIFAARAWQMLCSVAQHSLRLSIYRLTLCVSFHRGGLSSFLFAGKVLSRLPAPGLCRSSQNRENRTPLSGLSEISEIAFPPHHRLRHFALFRSARFLLGFSPAHCTA